MSPEDMSNKAHMLCDEVIGRDSVDALIERTRNIEMLSNLSEIMQLVVPAAPVRAAIGGRRV